MMSIETSQRLRRWVLFWVVFPLLGTLFLIATLALVGTLAGPNAKGLLGSFGFGAAFLAAFAPLIAAHVVVAASLVGVIGMVFGMRWDWKLLTAVLIGLVSGGLVLWRIYAM
jgi:hypothetical protein